MTKRRWQIEYMNAEGAWIPLDKRRFRFYFAAVRAMHASEADQPGVMMHVRKER